MTLQDLAPGQSALVLEVHESGEASHRLMEMGVFEGSVVRLVRRAPLGDPLEIEVRGAFLSLRRSEAALVLVEPRP